MEQTLQAKGYKNYKKGHNAQQIKKRMQNGMD